ncbi:PRC-barrel domain-containing protein [Halalkalibacter okhensis]|uniref:PRC-barrel domain-containing protein n=1 Tax=Halalkalibacter okhensis TaxID=333138 RepID=A0A0B0IDD0_9BACI|nr:PRC-barrel domain-containing protein [Halalkalibacter okhensis]KHF38847.1 hypothetical protein LQ50_18645 [Halalkalibacter okhensis]
MYHKFNHLTSFSVVTKEGAKATIDDLTFDPSLFSLRYIVVDTRTWFIGGKTLISPATIKNINIEEKIIALNVTKEQMTNSPKRTIQSPISFGQKEKSVIDYDRKKEGLDSTTSFINGGDLSGTPITGIKMSSVIHDYGKNEEQMVRLQSVKSLREFDAYAMNDKLGVVSDLIINDQKWTIDLVEIEIGDLLSKQVAALSTSWITEINWNQRKILMNKEKLDKDGQIRGRSLFTQNELRFHVEAGQPPSSNGCQ